MKRLVAVLLTGIMLMSNGVVAFASDLSVSGGTASGSTPTSFEVDTSILGGDLVVSIPAEMVLTYDSANEKFTNTDVVTAKGRITASKRLEVQVPSEIEYENADDTTIKVSGSVDFGSTSMNNMEKGYWSAAELLTGLTATPVERDIVVDVNKADISYIGTYSTNITYSISVVD